MNNTYHLDDILTPQARESLRHLELYARKVVDGVLHGAHRSRRKGVSTDFDHHKNYQPGDSLKHVDWKVSARHANRDNVIDCGSGHQNVGKFGPRRASLIAKRTLAGSVVRSRADVGIVVASSHLADWAILPFRIEPAVSQWPRSSTRPNCSTTSSEVS